MQQPRRNFEKHTATPLETIQCLVLCSGTGIAVYFAVVGLLTMSEQPKDQLTEREISRPKQFHTHH